jgi:hypothetical protein
MSRRTVGVVLAAIGAIGIAGSFAWREAVEPRLVKYPTDLDETPEYAGTVSIYLDPVSYAPLDPPTVAPLSVSRHLDALGDESSSDLVVISEQISLVAEGQFEGQIDSQYVMDRETIENVDDPRAWAFTSDNVVDRAPAFRLAFPFDTKAEPALVYKNEVATTYTAEPAGEGNVDGLDVLEFEADQSEPLPISPAYFQVLNGLTPLPTQLTLDQLRPILLSVGLDIDALLPALVSSLSPEDTQTLVGLAGQPISLEYAYTFSGADSVEPSTGSIVEVRDVVETLWASPDPAVLDTLRTVLGRYPNVQAAVQGAAVVEQLAAEPIRVFTNEYSQTEESVADIAGTVKDAKKLKQLAESTIPQALLFGGIALTVLGLLLALWPKRKQRAGRGPSASPVDGTDGAEQPVEVRLAPGETVTIKDPTGPTTPP